ncbi:unnamed protein product [Darwinula stevensoni]|uniref:BHLH domain-containing protein n=1 Tax=Darwinula stevensoni TaxID=69355 RepID=A0A7R9A8V7_9CRUS|nr:unnamed protein product [Darwinula stevensoni]CAG0896778.1 unnamed protein product [Darwinula stevensoni]
MLLLSPETMNEEDLLYRAKPFQDTISDSFGEDLMSSEWGIPNDEVWKKFGVGTALRSPSPCQDDGLGVGVCGPDNFWEFKSPFTHASVYRDLRHDCSHNNFLAPLSPVSNEDMDFNDLSCIGDDDADVDEDPEVCEDETEPESGSPEEKNASLRDHCYLSNAFQDVLPTPSDSEEEDAKEKDWGNMKRSCNFLKTQPLNPEIQRKLQLAMTALAKRRNQSGRHILQVPSKNGTETLEVRIGSVGEKRTLTMITRREKVPTTSLLKNPRRRKNEGMLTTSALSPPPQPLPAADVLLALGNNHHHHHHQVHRTPMTVVTSSRIPNPLTLTSSSKKQHQEVSGNSGSCSGSDSDDKDKVVRNSSERMRRIQMKNAFEELRVVLPETARLEKAPKLSILRAAISQCRKLTAQEALLRKEKLRLVARKKALEKKLNSFASA